MGMFAEVIFCINYIRYIYENFSLRFNDVRKYVFSDTIYCVPMIILSFLCRGCVFLWMEKMLMVSALVKAFFNIKITIHANKLLIKGPTPSHF